MTAASFHLNEVRVDRHALDRFPILAAEGLGLSQRHSFLLQRRIGEALQAPVVSHGRFLGVVLASGLEANDFWNLLEGEGLEGYARVLTTLGQLPFGTRRRLMGAILAYQGYHRNVFQEGFLDFYEYSQVASVFYDSLSMTVLEDSEFYRLFLEPGSNAFYHLADLNPERVAEQEWNLRALEIPGSEGRRGGGFLGFLLDIVDASAVDTEEELVLVEGQDDIVEHYARLKRTSRSQSTYLVPTRLLLVKPSYDLLVEYNHLRALRERTLLRPSERCSQIKEWYERLFPNDRVSVGEKLTATANLHFVFMDPVEYDGTRNQDASAFFYPENPLKFGPNQPGNVQLSDPHFGIRNFGPLDLRFGDQSRPVESIHPYIIRPREENLAWRAYHLFRFFEEGGYRESGDREFRGFEREFRVQFEMPGQEDSEPDCATDEEYLTAADRIVEKWRASDGDPCRIVLVVFPFDQEDSLEDSEFTKRLYPQLKQKFLQAGLPSQMIDRSTLEKIHFQDDRRGSGARLRFDDGSYFGHVLWNLALNIYVKMGGRPWTLQRELDNVNCLIGLSFSVNALRPDRPMYVGVANVFDEFGEWVDIMPDQTQLGDAELKTWYESRHRFYSEETASSKLSRDFTAEIIRKSVQTYEYRRGRKPLSIVVHKTGQLHSVELEGVLQGIKAAGISLPEVTVGFVSLIQNHDFRMYGETTSSWQDDCVVRRGVMCILEPDRALLATTGRTERTRHLLGTPQPLEVRVERPSPEILESVGLDRIHQYSAAQLCEQLMALTQLHWGSMRREIKLPVTTLFSQKVARLSARAEVTTLPEGRIHRPWFI